MRLVFGFYLPQIGPDGKMLTDDRYREILRLYDMLAADSIPCVLQKRLDGWQLEYPCRITEGARVCSVVQNFGSYGHEDDRLEIMGLLTAEEEENDSVLGWMTAEEEENDSVLGWMTAEDVYLRIVSHYMNTQEASRVAQEEQ